jgi:hypothetical protein
MRGSDTGRRPEELAVNFRERVYRDAELEQMRIALNDAWRHLRLIKHPLATREREEEIRLELGKAIMELAERGVRNRKLLSNHAFAAVARRSVESAGASE